MNKLTFLNKNDMKLTFLNKVCKCDFSKSIGIYYGAGITTTNFKMDTVVKGMLEDDEDEKKGLVIFGRDLSKIPCFRESFMYGIATGIGVGFASFIKTSKPMLSQHIAVGTFSISTLLYWSYCRVQWSRQKFDAQLMQDALKDKIRYEGTAVEKELEEKGILKSV